jgi:hypothetical protein
MPPDKGRLTRRHDSPYREIRTVVARRRRAEIMRESGASASVLTRTSLSGAGRRSRVTRGHYGVQLPPVQVWLQMDPVSQLKVQPPPAHDALQIAPERQFSVQPPPAQSKPQLAPLSQVNVHFLPAQFTLQLVPFGHPYAHPPIAQDWLQFEPMGHSHDMLLVPEHVGSAVPPSEAAASPGPPTVLVPEPASSGFPPPTVQS